MFSRADLIRLMWPLLIEQLLNVLVGMVDVLMVSSLGEASVSGVSLVDSISVLMVQITAALGTGGAVVCSQYIGKKDPEKACRSAGQLILVTVSVSSVISIGCLVGGRGLLGLIFGQVEADVMENARIYFVYIACSYPFLALYSASAALFRSMGNSRVSMLVSTGVNLTNVAGNALCVYLLHMDVTGVAIPTLLSRIGGALVMMILIRNPRLPIHIRRLREFIPHGKMIRNILSVGVPHGLENGMFQFGKLMLSSLVSTTGTASIAAYAVSCNLATFMYLPGNALSLGMVTVVGQCIGAGETGQAKHYARVIVGLNYLLLAFIATAMGFGSPFLVSFFNLSEEATSIATSMIVIHALAMIIWPPAFCLPSALRAGMDSRFTMMVSATVMWVFRVGGAYFFLLVLHTNILGVWYAMFIDWFVRFCVYLLRFRKFETRARQVS